ncbi:MAG: M14 family zinc carboxypeptidase [Ignavibacteriota bacterium]
MKIPRAWILHSPFGGRLCLVLLAALGLSAQTSHHITSPKEEFGFNIGDDYRLVNYTQLEAYWKKLATESDRVKLSDIGMTAEGRHQWMAIVSSPANLKNLARYQEISRKLAASEGVSSDQAHALASEGKAVV